jgi:hypothetical protein
MAGLSGTIKARPRGFTLPGKGRQAQRSDKSRRKLPGYGV